MRPGALESLQRGALNLRANGELVVLIWLQQLLLVLLTLASLVPFYLLLELHLPPGLSTPEAILSWLVELSEQLVGQMASLPFWMAMIASSAVLTLVAFVYSFFQAGAFGILSVGERGAASGQDGAAVDGFRAFSWRAFQVQGGQFLWRFFWLFNLIVIFWTGWLLLVVVAGLTSALTAGSAGVAAGLALGCAAVLPLAFGAVLLVFWFWFAQAEIVALDCGVWVGLLGGLRLTTRRLASVAALAVLLVIIATGAAIVFSLLALTLNAGLAGFELVRGVLVWLLQAVQWLVSGAIHLVFAGALVSLVRVEHAAASGRGGPA